LKNTCCIVWRNNLNEMYNGTVQSLYGGGSAAVTNKVLSSQTATLTAAGAPLCGRADGHRGRLWHGQFNGTFVITATTTNTFSYHSAQANVASTGCAGMSVVNPNNVMFVGWLQSKTIRYGLIRPIPWWRRQISSSRAWDRAWQGVPGSFWP
jgi:hypothetical protein